MKFSGVKELSKDKRGLFLVVIFTACAFVGFSSQSMAQTKPIIYQLLPRLFGNKQSQNIPYGTIQQNGSGKFADINNKALDGIKELGVSHVWYTGVIAHASLTDYSAFGIPTADADVVKGRAGSPYAISDYYDVDPDLAVDVKDRMLEFEALIARTHQKGMKVIIDFVPNHVARSYYSLAKPAGIKDFGAEDDLGKSFSPVNDYYYIPGKDLVVPVRNELANALRPLEDQNFKEIPAKATGNNVFSAIPSKDDWYETVKLNYGLDYANGEQQYFNPRPGVWLKMRDILSYWAVKGVDGFRCDMAEMVPVEFWEWVIPELKMKHPGLIFIGEAYNPAVYQTYLTKGHFDYLYDKVGLYDGLKKLIRNEEGANVQEISKVWQVQTAGFGNRMLSFLENHDEERIASAGFAGDPTLAIPAMVVSATLSAGPVMLYFGQEVGEPGKGIEGFGKEDNRTTIFDYWGVPEHQKWMNNGAFDGALLDSKQQNLRAFYKDLMHIATSSRAITKGDILEIPLGESRMYAFLRYTDGQRLLIVANFDASKVLERNLEIPVSILKNLGIKEGKDLLSKLKVENTSQSLYLKVLPQTAQIIEF
ncbi:alpha-amylase family glycosyl hydrolase [Pedobacter gandavensis]|uniref:alpha-amylase family glycosyl hydrolase n=1 Tax=Pedobacter gandavensis TaxID=2679963 RepID=UPI0029305DC3|nr:alpha-amylase family glycosyl hydrolase [Pedobacter gandavensis]